MALITLDQAKRHLQILHDDMDEEIEEKVNEASAIVLDYLKVAEDAYEVDAVPYLVQSATKLVLGALCENREGNASGPEPLSQAVKDLLHRYRDPALA
jgi:hypothetical protein